MKQPVSGMSINRTNPEVPLGSATWVVLCFRAVLIDSKIENNTENTICAFEI
jgi:hypothetical protein